MRNVWSLCTATMRRAYAHFVNDSLYRNSIYLLVNMAVNTVAGFVFMLICTRIFSQKDVGYAIAMISALNLALSFSNIGLNRTIARFLGRSKTKAQDLVTKVVLISASSVVASVVLSFFFTSLGFKDTSLMATMLFVAAVLLNSIKALFDNAFIAMRKSSGFLVSSTFSNAAKLAFPFLVGGLGYMGMFSSLLACAVVSVAVSAGLLIWRAEFNFLQRPSRASMQGKWRFAFGAYTSDLIGNLPISIVPLIVISKLGPTQSALWYGAMQFTNFLLMVTSSVNQAMFAEMSSATDGISIYIKKALVVMYGLLIPMAVLVMVFATQFLGLLGHEYVPAAHVLRLMAVFALIGVLNYISGSILAYYKQVMYLTFVNVCNAIVVIAYSTLFATDLNGIAIGWMLGEVANVVLFVGGAWLYTKRKAA